MSTKFEQALAGSGNGLNCCQSLVSVYAEDFGLARETAIRISAAFGGGIARMGETCGAVTAGLMVIGLKFGPRTAVDAEAKQDTFNLAGKFVEAFKARNNCLTCRELLGFDMSTPEGKEAAKESGSFDICPKLIESSIEILEGILKAT